MSPLQPSLNLYQGLGTLMAALLGTGVFIVPELTVKAAQAGALWSWALLALAILPVAFVFALLGRAYPHAGGASHYISMALGQQQGRLIGWLFLALLSVGMPAAMEMALWFLQVLLPLSPLQSWLTKLLLLGLMVLISIQGISLSGNVQAVIAALVSLLLLGLVVASWGQPVAPARQLDALPWQGWLSMAPALALGFWSFIGIEVIAHLSTEFKRPERDFPLALILGVTLVGGLYWLGSWLVYAYAADYQGQQPAMIYLVESLLGGWLGQHGAQVIGSFGFLSCVATMNIYLGSASRLLWSLAQEEPRLSRLSQLNRYRVPAWALYSLALMAALSISILTLLGLDLEAMIKAANGIIVLVYILTMVAGWRLLARRYRLLSLLGLLVCLALAWTLGAAMLYVLVLYPLLMLLQKRLAAPSWGKPLSEQG
ncbi:L-methionine/branched-chain amino acid transporter [Balneatrix alpica]|uniref:L-methionine/branched-chain amino acid transporter n=1 Tax=Balneatrix alpica TaxID=75684 RepID=A0ABV5ZD93_9GAMM|nr:L-methionine/branched-chain amino acid transporter [Balneatrix alpica]